MTFKRYIFLLLSGALILFLALPLFNYSVDQWRVLHLDYENIYEGIEPNKNYLKMSYLLKHKDAYDTLLMGSSRVGHIDTDHLPGRAYNMTISSGVVGVHLENLKILLKNKVKIKRIWLGINDFVMWTYYSFHETDYLRVSYKDDFWGKINVYKFYLFKIPRKRDLQIFLKINHKLVEYPVISHPRISMGWSRQEEEKVLESPLQHRQKMLMIPPAAPSNRISANYRIDKVIAEFAEFKQLCEDHGIALTTFVVPSYYKSYLATDQYYIQDLKKKLINLTSYHDFYQLNEISMDDSKWFDAVHFVPSIGDFITESINKNTFLVTKKSFTHHFDDQVRVESTLLSKVIWEKQLGQIYILPYYAAIQGGRTIFDLLDGTGGFEKNFEIDLSPDEGKMILNHKDPILKLDPINSVSRNAILHYKIDCSKNTVFDIFYRKKIDDQFSVQNRLRASLHKGSNQLTLAIPSQYLQNGLRVDLVSAKGEYCIREFRIVEEDVTWAE